MTDNSPSKTRDFGLTVLQRPRHDELTRLVSDLLPGGSPRRIMVKPNWVKHQVDGRFPIGALVTSPAVISATIQACLDTYEGVESITVGDVPLQSCDFERMWQQSGMEEVRERFARLSTPRIQFLDLRRERYSSIGGYLAASGPAPGDPLGYAEVVLDGASYLEAVSRNASRFRVSDYDPEETASAHGPGMHRYLIARSVLEADLFINLPKMKTHQKGGITGALKNLVGINGDKARLVHHQLGKPSRGGDEFPEDIDPMIVLQTRIRERVQKRGALAYAILKPAWQVIKKVRGIKTDATPENLMANFYKGAGSWYGNDSIWRMVYDLNMIVLYAGPEGGTLLNTPQRRYLAILDGLIAGEGNGPLQPLPVDTGVVALSENPFLVDMAMARMMGFDRAKIPVLAHAKEFKHKAWASIDPGDVRVMMDRTLLRGGIDGLPVLRRFLPPPGWLSHIELTGAGQN